MSARSATARQLALDRMAAASAVGDPETTHIEADAALCELLRRLGYHDVVDAFEALPRWYS